MNYNLAELKRELENLEIRITNEIQESAKRFEYQLERGKVVFSTDVIERHKKRAQNTILWLLDAKPSYLLVSPFVYILIVPMVLMDIFISTYQAINFRVYGIGRVKRKDHIIIDRHRLRYLNIIERLNCAYCGYVNGLLSYVTEVAARTERFWCPIRHARSNAPRHSQARAFVDYGDDNYSAYLDDIRKELQRLRNLVSGAEIRRDPDAIVVTKKAVSRKKNDSKRKTGPSASAKKKTSNGGRR